MMSFVVSSAGGIPVGAETVGTSPAFAETVGRDPAVDDVSDEFIFNTPKIARATRATARMDATITRGFFMRCTLSLRWP